jgi:hypothetical protein
VPSIPESITGKVAAVRVMNPPMLIEVLGMTIAMALEME